MLKRLFDIIVSAAALLVLSPLLLVLALIVRLTSPGPALYRATRVGRGGELFTLYKVRSMVADADKHGPAVTGSGDPRITPIGRVLRRTKLDELPQFFNVLRGDMSLVGPRPEDPRYVAHYTPTQREVLSVRPGITSPATLHYRHEEALVTSEAHYIAEIMPAKLAIELGYIRQATLRSDIGILVRTLFKVMSNE
jgi:lipopolysaccharide/colanic/teichoic acid biosynthesis glycosyltransferase